MPLAKIPTVTEVRSRSQALQVVDLSRGGMLIESAVRWLPGSASLLEIVRTNGALRLRAQVVRSQVWAVAADKLRFRVGIVFDRPLDFIEGDFELNDYLHEFGPSVPACDAPPALPDVDLDADLPDTERIVTPESLIVTVDLAEIHRFGLEQGFVENVW